jgi:hypothetical protein
MWRVGRQSLCTVRNAASDPEFAGVRVPRSTSAGGNSLSAGDSRLAAHLPDSGSMTMTSSARTEPTVTSGAPHRHRCSMASATKLALTPVDMVGLRMAAGPVDVVALVLRMPREPDVMGAAVPVRHPGSVAGTEDFILDREIHHSTPIVSHCK